MGQPAARDWAISFSWWGKRRSRPPPWMSKASPRNLWLMAEHSRCQPGRPFPKGASHEADAGSEGLGAFQRAKSLGNGLGVEEVCEKFSPWALRFALGSVHYRSMLEWGEEAGKEAMEVERRVFRFKEEAEAFLGRKISPKEPESLPREALPEKFSSAMDSDLSVGPALAALFESLRSLNSSMRSGRGGEGIEGQILSAFAMLSVLGLSPLDPAWEKKGEEDALSPLVEALVGEREKARRDRDFGKADAIRRLLKGAGVALEDGKSGTSWRRLDTEGGIN